MNEAACETTPALPESSSYLRETSQPLYSAALVLPFLLAYEAGLIFLRSDVINGGDAILLNLGAPILRWLGVNASIVSLVVLGAYFVIQQFRKSGEIALRLPRLGLLLFECLLYAVLLYALLGLLLRYLPGMDVQRPRPAAHAVHATLTAEAAPAIAVAELTEHPVATHGATHDTPLPLERRAAAHNLPRYGPLPLSAAPEPYRPGLKDFVLFCGAGVYEELVFRVLLLGLLMLVFTKLFHMEHAVAAVWSTLLGAVLFSAFHHIGGEQFHLGAFSQRIFAGVYFSALYFTRSFGVAAASHAFYDIVWGLDQYI